MSDEWVFEDFGGRETKGKPFIGRGDSIFCPECKTEITDDPGYGMAFGGMGTYWCCDSDKCDWFFKVMDADE